MSAVNDPTPLGIKEKDINLLRNNLIKFDCGPLVYRTVIDWGFAKPDGIKIIDHIYHLKIGDVIKKKNFPKWLTDNKSKLDNDSFSDFDITTLHDFLPILCCNKIAQYGSKEYVEQMKDSESVESLLKEIKEFRNEVSHEFSKAVKDSHIDEMRDTMIECIRAAGKLYVKDQTEIDEKVKDLDEKFDKVLTDTTNLYENRVKYIAQKISSEVPSNMLDRYSPYFSVSLPGSSKKIDTSDIFQCSNLSVTTEDKKDNKIVFPCTGIYNNTQEKFVVINGDPGSGKTTLMKNLCQDILQTSVNGSTPRFEKVEQFKIPVYLECRYEQQSNLAKFLRECLTNFLSPEDDIYEAFKIVKGLVFIIDGYDEIPDKCRKLVDSIISFCRDNNASCIVSSRVDAGIDFVNELQEKSLNYTKMFIEPISKIKDKLNFLQEVAGKMDDHIDTDKLVKSFENLTEAAIEVFSSPILLTLFISLFVHDPDSVSKMKNEHSAYEAVRNNFLREIERKLRNASYPLGRAEDVAYVLGKFCLKLFKARKYFLYMKDYTKMTAECENIKEMPDDVDIPNLLSCILTPEHSLKYNQDISYQFFHSTIQEFFAAKYVSEKIREFEDNRSSHGQLDSIFFSDMKKAIVKKLHMPARGLKDDKSSQSQLEDRQLPKLLQVLKLRESQKDIEREMGRYGNIIKLLMLEILATGQLTEYRNTFTLMLKKYYQPRDEFDFLYPEYHLDLILSSDSNADIISIVSDCLRDWEVYSLENCRHIKPMTEVIMKLKTRIKIDFTSLDTYINTEQLIKLLTVLRDDSQIRLYLLNSYIYYEPLEGEFYTQLMKSKCKVTKFMACISSEEHLSILVRAFRGNMPDNLDISTPSVFNFAVLEEFKGYSLELKIKFSEDFSITGSNPVRARTTLTIENIPADGKDKTFKLIKYLCPKSKLLRSIKLDNCHLIDTDANELLEELHREEIRTGWGDRTEVKERRLNEDKSRDLELNLKESEPTGRLREESEDEESEEERRKKTKCVIS